MDSGELVQSLLDCDISCSEGGETGSSNLAGGLIGLYDWFHALLTFSAGKEYCWIWLEVLRSVGWDSCGGIPDVAPYTG